MQVNKIDTNQNIVYPIKEEELCLNIQEKVINQKNIDHKTKKIITL